MASHNGTGSGKKHWHSLREYQALRATLATGTTTAAALQLGLSQSAVSRSLAALEGRQGISLFLRDAGRLVPTEEALQLNRRLDALFDALAEIDQSEVQSEEHLRLVAPFTIGHRMITPILPGFNKANINTFVSLDVGTSSDVMTGVVENRIDLGFTGIHLARRGIKLLPFRRSNAAVVLPENHPLCAKARLTIEDISSVPMVALSYRHPGRAQLEKAAHERGLKLQIVMDIATAVDAIALVRAGLGISVINPFPVLLGERGGIAVRPLEAPIDYCTYFVMADHRPPSRAARAFMRYAKMAVPAHELAQNSYS